MLLALPNTSVIDAAVLLVNEKFAILLKKLMLVLLCMILTQEFNLFILEGTHLRIEKIVYRESLVVVERVPYFEVVSLARYILEQKFNVEVRSLNFVEQFLVWHMRRVCVI